MPLNSGAQEGRRGIQIWKIPRIWNAIIMHDFYLPLEKAELKGTAQT